MNTSVASPAGEIASTPMITSKRSAASGIASRVWPDSHPSSPRSEGLSRLDFSTSYDGFTSEGSRILFRLVAPFATSVKLAADFTGWERNPIDLLPGGNGVWQVSVPLPPGRYAYRYVLDGGRSGPGESREHAAVVVVI
jgi:hypothetical protein